MTHMKSLLIIRFFVCVQVSPCDLVFNRDWTNFCTSILILSVFKMISKKTTVLGYSHASLHFRPGALPSFPHLMIILLLSWSMVCFCGCKWYALTTEAQNVMQAPFSCMWIIVKRSNYVPVLGNSASYPQCTGHIVKGKKISSMHCNFKFCCLSSQWQNSWFQQCWIGLCY